MEYEEFSGKSLEAALQEAADHFGVPQEELDYEVTEEGSSGFLGFGGKPTTIRARKKFSLTGEAESFLSDVLNAMNMDIELETTYDDEEKTISIDLKGDDMGILIGKRGQTLDSLQYLTSLVVNRSSDEYVRVKLDIENYRERRKETLETLAKNIAYKVRRTRKPVSLEPMNPYERRIIHSALQSDKYVTTKSEGEDPYRHVVILLKNPAEGMPERAARGGRNGAGRGGRGRNNYRSARSSYGRYGSSSRYDSEARPEGDSEGRGGRSDFRQGRRGGYGSRYGSDRQERGGSRYGSRSRYGSDGDFYKNSYSNSYRNARDGKFYSADGESEENTDSHGENEKNYGRYDEDSTSFGGSSSRRTASADSFGDDDSRTFPEKTVDTDRGDIEADYREDAGDSHRENAGNSHYDGADDSLREGTGDSHRGNTGDSHREDAGDSHRGNTGDSHREDAVDSHHGDSDDSYRGQSGDSGRPDSGEDSRFSGNSGSDSEPVKSAQNRAPREENPPAADRRSAPKAASKKSDEERRKAILNKYNNVIEDDVAMNSYRNSGSEQNGKF